MSQQDVYWRQWAVRLLEEDGTKIAYRNWDPEQLRKEVQKRYRTGFDEEKQRKFEEMCERITMYFEVVGRIRDWRKFAYQLLRVSCPSDADDEDLQCRIVERYAQQEDRIIELQEMLGESELKWDYIAYWQGEIKDWEYFRRLRSKLRLLGVQAVIDSIEDPKVRKAFEKHLREINTGLLPTVQRDAIKLWRGEHIGGTPWREWVLKTFDISDSDLSNEGLQLRVERQLADNRRECSRWHSMLVEVFTAWWSFTADFNEKFGKEMHGRQRGTEGQDSSGNRRENGGATSNLREEGKEGEGRV